jgi:hypothetical protein
MTDVDVNVKRQNEADDVSNDVEIKKIKTETTNAVIDENPINKCFPIADAVEIKKVNPEMVKNIVHRSEKDFDALDKSNPFVKRPIIVEFICDCMDKDEKASSKFLTIQFSSVDYMEELEDMSYDMILEYVNEALDAKFGNGMHVDDSIEENREVLNVIPDLILVQNKDDAAKPKYRVLCKQQ